MTADSDAFNVVNSLPGLTLLERQYLLTIARGEGFYGLGWGSPSQKTIEESAQFGIDPMAGVGSNNWGANQEHGDADPPTFQHIDHHKDHTPYVGNFARYTTPQKSASRIAALLLKPNVKAAVNAGDLKAAVFAQKANGYYEATPEDYLKAVSQNYAILTSSLKWPPLLTSTPPVNPGAPGGPTPPPLPSGSPSSGQVFSYYGEPSVSRGKTGETVRLWQKIIGATPDGIFGPITETRTKQWQSLHKLVPDGIVGPATWRSANGQVIQTD